MDFITRSQARQDIIALALPQMILDAFDNKPLPYNLDISFCEPYQIFSMPVKVQAAYGQGRITPIWTGGHTIVAYHHAPDRNGFFRFNIESQGEDFQSFGLNWQQVLVREFKFFWEQEWTDERLREVAGWFEFKCVDLLIAELSHAKLDTFEKDTAWYESFLQKIGN